MTITPLKDSLTDEITYWEYTPKIPKEIRKECVVKQSASKQFGEIQLKKANMSTITHGKPHPDYGIPNMENIAIGRKIMTENYHITLADIALKKPDEIVAFVNQRMTMLFLDLPKMPTLYNSELSSGVIMWTQDKYPDSTQAITHYAPPVDIPVEKPIPEPLDPKEIDHAIDLLNLIKNKYCHV